jgi:hypothetical protein
MQVCSRAFVRMLCAIRSRRGSREETKIQLLYDKLVSIKPTVDVIEQAVLELRDAADGRLHFMLLNWSLFKKVQADIEITLRALVDSKTRQACR